MKKLLHKLLTIVLIIKCFLNNQPTLMTIMKVTVDIHKMEKKKAPLGSGASLGQALILGMLHSLGITLLYSEVPFRSPQPERFLCSNVFRSCLYWVAPHIPDQNLAWTQSLTNHKKKKKEDLPLLHKEKRIYNYIHKEDLQADLVP